MVKEDEEGIRERRVILYFYLKDRAVTSNKVTMIQVSALAPITGSYEGIESVEEEFLSDAFPYMFGAPEK